MVSLCAAWFWKRRSIFQAQRHEDVQVRSPGTGRPRQISNGPNKSIQHNLNANYTHIFSEENSSEITANPDYYHNLSEDAVSQIPSYDIDGTQYLTWGNFGTQHIGVASMNVAALPIGKWFQWTASATGLLGNSTSTISGIKRKICSAILHTDGTFVLPEDWKIDLDAFYQSHMTYGSFMIHQMWSSNIAVKKNLLENRLTMTIRLDDIFRSMSTNLDTIDESGSGVVTAFQQLYSNQKLVLDLTWNFGHPTKPVKERNIGGFEEMTRVGSSSGTVGK